MIINVAGTSGSGKTHLIRGFLAWAGKRGIVKPCFTEERKSPIGYDIILPRKQRPVKFVPHVVGAYEDVDSAGCDTFRDVVWIFDHIRKQHEAGRDVIYEGLFMMNMTRGPQLAAEFGEELCVLQLAVPLSVCLASINARREARGEGPLRNKENTVGNYKRAENYCVKMRGAGARVIRVKREEALPALLEVLGSDAV